MKAILFLHTSFIKTSSRFIPWNGVSIVLSDCLLMVKNATPDSGDLLYHQGFAIIDWFHLRMRPWSPLGNSRKVPHISKLDTTCGSLEQKRSDLTLNDTMVNCIISHWDWSDFRMFPLNKKEHCNASYYLLNKLLIYCLHNIQPNIH